MYQHMKTDKDYVLRTINIRLKQMDGRFECINITVYKNKEDKHPKMPTQYDEVIELLKDYDKVYEFYEMESAMHGLRCYDIILEG